MMTKAFIQYAVSFALLLSVFTGCAERAGRQSIQGVDAEYDSIDKPRNGSVEGRRGFDGLDEFVAKIEAFTAKNPGVVVVFPALSPTPDSDVMHVNGLGNLLMEKTAAALKIRGGKSILSGLELSKRLLAEGTSPDALRGVEDAYLLADLLGADYVVFGIVEHQVFDRLRGDYTLEIDWECKRVKSQETVAIHSREYSGALAHGLLESYQLKSDWQRSVTAKGRRLGIELLPIRWPDYEVPNTRQYTAFVKMPSNTSPAAEGVMTEALPKGSKVVIGVPATPSDAKRGKVFRTAGYFNRVEQIFEQTLTGMGLRVVDRTAFEAKLRQVEAESGAEMPKQIYDAADLFRLAREGDLGADYMLQINAFDVGVGDEIVVDVRSDPSYQKFLEQVPGVELPSGIELYGLFAQLNAKLIDIKNGTIAWNGVCRADIRHIAGLDTTFKITVNEVLLDTQTPSRESIEGKLALIRKQWNRVRNDLANAYDSDDRNRAVVIEKRFDDLLRSYKDLARAAAGYKPVWGVGHHVSIESPAELVFDNKAAEEKIARKLSDVSARALLKSIKVRLTRSDAQLEPQVNRNAELCERLEAELGYDHLTRAFWYADRFYHTVIDKPDLDLVDFPPLDRENNPRFPELLLQEARRHYLQFLSRSDVLPKYAWQETRTYRYPHRYELPENPSGIGSGSEGEIVVLYEFKMDGAKLNVHREVRSTRGNIIERSRIFTSGQDAGAVATWDNRAHKLMEVSEPSEKTQLQEPFRSIAHPGKGAKELFDFIRRGNY